MEKTGVLWLAAVVAVRFVEEPVQEPMAQAGGQPVEQMNVAAVHHAAVVCHWSERLDSPGFPMAQLPAEWFLLSLSVAVGLSVPRE